MFHIRCAATVKAGAQTKKTIGLGAGRDRKAAAAPQFGVCRAGTEYVSAVGGTFECRRWEVVSVSGSNLRLVGKGHDIMVSEARAVLAS